MLAHFQCAVMHALLQYEVSLGDEVVFDLVTHVTHGREIQVERGVVVAGEFGDLTHRDLLDRLGLVQLPERLLEALDRLLRKLRVLLELRFAVWLLQHKTHNPIDSSVKFVTFIDAMLSLVVTQDVLLESQGTAHAAQSSGLFGIGLGAVTMIIGLWMLLRRRWTVLASGEDSPDDAVPAVEITAETEA